MEFTSTSPFMVGFSIIFIGYILQSSFLSFWFYYYQQNNPKQWKIQYNKSNRNNNIPLNFYFLTLFSSKPNRAPFHGFISTFNLIIGSIFLGIIFQLSYHKSYNLFNFESIESMNMIFSIILKDFMIAVIYELIIEYYWHRLMHTKFFYTIFHKYHHAYKSPEVWDDMYIHPIEAFGYYCILYSPPFLFSIHIYSFILYMILMGLCGVLDHSGIKFQILSCYNTEDHDLHHSKFNINYSFPFPLMDIIHNTYQGSWLGMTFTAPNSTMNKSNDKNDISVQKCKESISYW